MKTPERSRSTDLAASALNLRERDAQSFTSLLCGHIKSMSGTPIIKSHDSSGAVFNVDTRRHVEKGRCSFSFLTMPIKNDCVARHAAGSSRYRSLPS